MPTVRGPVLLNAADPINKGLVGFWPLDDNASSGMRRDISSYRRNMASPVPPSVELSQQGRASKFNGSSTYLQNSTFAWPGGQNAAVSLWVKTPGGIGGSPWDFGGRMLVSGNAFYGHLPFADNNLYLYYGATSTGEISTSFAAYLNKWTHVAWSTSGSRKVVWINGVLAVSSGTVSPAVAAGTGAYVGYSPVSVGYDNAAMRLFRLYNRPLSDADAMRLFREPWAGTRRLRTPQSGLAPIVGTLAVTLADATLSSTGTLAIAGQAAITLADATLSATGLNANPIVVVGGGGTSRTRRGARRVYLQEPESVPILLPASLAQTLPNATYDDDEDAWILLG